MYVATYTTCTERRKNTEIDTFVRRCTYSTSCTFVPSKVLSYFRTSLILRRYCTVCSYVRVQYVKVRTKVSSKIIGTFVLSYKVRKYFQNSTFVHTKKVLIRKYFRTKVLSYESTKVLSKVLSYFRKYSMCTLYTYNVVLYVYFRKYFRTFVSTFESTFLYSDLHSTFVQCYIHVYSCTRTRAVQ